MKLLSKTLFWVLLLCTELRSLSAQEMAVSPPSISILTCGRSSALYAAFGHSAIRINDPVNGLDLCFNYGTFNFDDPGFYMKFLKGNLDYFLSVSSFSSFLNEYRSEGRSVNEQVLNVTALQRNNIYRRLMQTYYSKARYYRYDFIKNNCCTKIAELLKAETGEKVLLPETPFGKGNTIRSYINRYLTDNDFLLTGVNMLLGYYADTISPRNTSIFLPDSLYYAFASLRVNNMLFVKDNHVILEQKPILKNPPLRLKSILYLLLWLNGVLFILYFLYNRSRRIELFFRIETLILFSVLGMAGIFLLAVWMFSEHQIVRYNLNLLWCNPLLFLYIRKSPHLYITVSVVIGMLVFCLFYFNSSYLKIIFPVLIIINLVILFHVLKKYLNIKTDGLPVQIKATSS